GLFPSCPPRRASDLDLLAGDAVPARHRRRGRRRRGRGVIPRYSLPEMASLWSDEHRFSTMLEVEILAVEAWSLLGTVPAADVATIRDRTAGMITTEDVAAIEERERITNHDVAAFVDVVAGRVGQPAGGWVHYGLTSSDVVDTTLSATLTRAATLLVEAAAALEEAIGARARELRDVPTVRRTPGIHAEPTTMRDKQPLGALQSPRERGRRRAVPHGGPEGQQRHAPQAELGALRADVRPGPGGAVEPPGRPGERRPVARARHLALLRRAGHPARLVDAGLLPAGEVQGDR